MSPPFVIASVIGEDEVNRQIALRFAPHHPVALLCSPDNKLTAAVSAAHDAGSEAVLFETDLSCIESIRASIASASAQLGKQCAAAVFQVRREAAEVPFLEQTAAQFRAATSSQIASAYAFSQAVMPLLAYGGGGGGGGSAEFPATLVYVGCDGISRSDKVVENALVALSRSLGREYGKKYIHIAHLKFKKGSVTKNETDADAKRDARVAETLWHLYTQPLSCFANEITI
ncbi:oxidoreductase, short chain dehydrogenase/reductase family [Cordyceps javanica]|uniref:Oxidoreductase, short chain dehydrogenase/reductase family n=1 Tax=Cordyceps javanica TaxID=43265 RepID=A0A545VAQ1_9HYPO|nr:oxidoreductase, short chain dehydrogenase/reductase family [Cordyceps javanica]TQW10017.1 oxidoreductase, short chain dehydrogenase/reductase family [Cordyceps javanica]